jgi:hypothetical protein
MKFFVGFSDQDWSGFYKTDDSTDIEYALTEMGFGLFSKRFAGKYLI